jgi:hypothetical protein
MYRYIRVRALPLGMQLHQRGIQLSREVVHTSLYYRRSRESTPTCREWQWPPRQRLHQGTLPEGAAAQSPLRGPLGARLYVRASSLGKLCSLEHIVPSKTGLHRTAAGAARHMSVAKTVSTCHGIHTGAVHKRWRRDLTGSLHRGRPTPSSSSESDSVKTSTSAPVPTPNKATGAPRLAAGGRKPRTSV